MSDARVVVAAHKPYWMPRDSCYFPIWVGAVLSDETLNFQRDDEGESISEKNPHFCELTALYWAWKNLEADYVGLVHYRRHFAGSGERGVLTGTELSCLLSEVPVLLPKPRNYFIETIGSHYAHTFSPDQIELMRQVVKEVEPDYSQALDDHLAQTKGHMWNMMVMRKDILDAYCSWLFPILDCIDGLIDYSAMSPFDARAVGRLSELLLDPWLAYNDVDYAECPVVSLEGENWLKKGTAFLGAKFLGKKYEASF